MRTISALFTALLIVTVLTWYLGGVGEMSLFHAFGQVSRTPSDED